MHGDGATHGSLLGPADRDLSSVWGQFNLHAAMRRHRMLLDPCTCGADCSLQIRHSWL